MWGVDKRLPGGNPLLWGDGVLTILGLCLLMVYGEGVSGFVIMRSGLWRSLLKVLLYLTKRRHTWTSQRKVDNP